MQVRVTNKSDMDKACWRVTSAIPIYGKCYSASYYCHVTSPASPDPYYRMLV